MFEGFDDRSITVDGVDIHTRVGGAGPPLLLLHGFPQSHMLWHGVAPHLARSFTVVLTDLRGYGRSSKPPGDAEHATYSKRRMAADQMAVMTALSFERFSVAGHDRGARVAHRMALDHPQRVERVAFLDIVPTLEVFERVDQAMATAYYHWFFLIQPNGLPEHLIGLDPQTYLRRTLGAWGSDPGIFHEEAVAAYLQTFCDPAAIHAMCEDYRAAATIDLAHDRADRAAGRTVDCPALTLWGDRSVVGRLYPDPLVIWRRYAPHIRGAGLPAGHFLPEERPQDTVDALLSFLSAPVSDGAPPHQQPITERPLHGRSVRNSNTSDRRHRR
ncbi:haloacetate dehalogenase [Azospirillum oryzae]|uniref:Haloacetate dehalogenase n=1 Tax=Azospirillum oryzae TaxID=286727 RepID=A0A1X7HQR2_9PROT|nr:alpha/beta hydrolase [Azospirillum oryzae]SMF90259.1 haloacetate dehalogenase [Azospirillum oryzae]